MTVHDLPQAEQLPMLRAGARDAIVGGRLYDAHIAEVARSTGAGVVVTDNRRHFLSALRAARGNPRRVPCNRQEKAALSRPV